MFLCERGLFLKGKDEITGTGHNGNFLGIIELLSRYDFFMANHIAKHANKGKRHQSYLSHTIYEELIRIMSNKFISTIVSELQNMFQFL